MKSLLEKPYDDIGSDGGEPPGRFDVAVIIFMISAIPCCVVLFIWTIVKRYYSP